MSNTETLFYGTTGMILFVLSVILAITWIFLPWLLLSKLGSMHKTMRDAKDELIKCSVHLHNIRHNGQTGE